MEKERESLGGNVQREKSEKKGRVKSGERLREREITGNVKREKEKEIKKEGESGESMRKYERERERAVKT